MPVFGCPSALSHEAETLYPRFISYSYSQEDTLQDILLKLWERRENLHRVESMENYLFLVVRNHLISESAKARAQKRNADVYFYQEAYSNITEEAILYREARRFYSSARDQLPPRSREAYELKEQGLSIHDIAQQMRITAPAVKEHLQQAKKKIRAFMAVRYN